MRRVARHDADRPFKVDPDVKILLANSPRTGYNNSGGSVVE
jgi:hypothetical protein